MHGHKVYLHKHAFLDNRYFNKNFKSNRIKTKFLDMICRQPFWDKLFEDNYFERKHF